MFKSSWTETLHSMANSRKHEKIRSTLLHYIYKIPHNWLTGICLSPATQAFLKKWKHARQHWFTIFLALCIYCYPYHSIHIIDIYICESIYLHWSLGLVIHAMHTHVNIRIWYLCVYIYIWYVYAPYAPFQAQKSAPKKTCASSATSWNSLANSGFCRQICRVRPPFMRCLGTTGCAWEKTEHEMKRQHANVKEKKGGTKNTFSFLDLKNWDLKDRIHKNTPWVFDHNKEALEDHNLESWHDPSQLRYRLLPHSRNAIL